MAGATDITTFAGRLATFQGPVQIVKRRASSAKKTKTSTTVEWPHQTPTPEQLARAGFYYKPSSASNDSVSCFMCKKSLDGWDPEDNPAVEHLNHVPNCGWAININIEQRNQDTERMEEDPLCEKLMNARRATFRDAWPHDEKKGWKCKLEKMVAAGWCYVPLPEADDCVQCFYCGVSLDGWEPKDDPWVEHQKRAPDCHFFSLIDEAAKATKSTKGRKGRTSRASRTSRLSTQSNLTIASDVGSVMDLDDLPAEVDDTIMTTMSTVSKAGGAKGRTKKANTKATRRTTKKAVDESTMEPPVDLETEEALYFNPQELVEQSIVSAKPKATRGRATRKQEDESQMQIEQSHIMEAVKPKRGRKRASDGTEKVDTSVMAQEVVPAMKQTRGKRAVNAETAQEEASQIDQSQSRSQEVSPAPKRGRLAKKTKSSEEERSILVTDTSLSQPAIPSPAPLAVPKAKSGKKASKLQIEETMIDEPVAEQVSSVFVARPPPPQIAAPAPTPVASPATEALDDVDVEIQSPGRESAAAQSSDAENRAPASSPFPATTEAESTPKPTPAALTTPTEQTPLAAICTTTPTTSPSRRTATALQTTAPWTAIDLSTVFLASPSKALPTSLTTSVESLQDVIARLSNEERDMSIEAWILHNASRAEEKLKGECERLIGAFEESGGNAVRSLRGVSLAV